MIEHSYYGIYKTAIYYLMTIFQQTLTRYTSQIRDQKVRAVLNTILTQTCQKLSVIRNTPQSGLWSRLWQLRL